MPKKSVKREAKFPKMALVVHSDVGVLSNLQSSLSDRGYTPIIARDLPTALLAMTQHYFDVAIVSSRLREGGDGWPLAGVLHLVFPRAFVSVLAPSEDVLTLQSAINYGVKEVYKESSTASDVVSAILAEVAQDSANQKPRLQ